MNLPFQAVECYLDGVYPYPGKNKRIILHLFKVKISIKKNFFADTEEDGKNYLSNLIKGSNLTATIVGFAEDGVPLIKLFLTNEEYEV